jgi:hypothetical protein
MLSREEEMKGRHIPSVCSTHSSIEYLAHPSNTHKGDDCFKEIKGRGEGEGGSGVM